MGNIKSLLVKNIEEFNKLLEDPEETIDKIITNTVLKLAKKQINKRSFSYDKTTRKLIETYDIYNLKLIDELQYKKYYFPKNISKNEYFEDSKDQFALELFRFVEHSIPSYSVSNTLFSIYNKNESLVSVFSDNFYKANKDFFKKTEYCSLNIYIQTSSKNFIIKIPKQRQTELLNDFKNYYLKLDNNLYNYNNVLNKLTSININPGQPNESVYYYTSYYNHSNQIFDIDNSYAFFIFFYFIINTCDNNFVYCNLDMDDANQNAHRNKLFLQKIHQPKSGKLDKINAYHYEPHGKNQGFSFSVIEIEKIYNKISFMVDTVIMKKDPSQTFISKIYFNTQSASCLIGPQTLTANVDIGYCTVFSTFWYNCLLNIIDIINYFDKKNQENYIKSKLRRKLSDVPIEDWIRKIDIAITNIKNNFKINYPEKQYKISEIIKNRNYMLDDDYELVENYINKFYISNPNDYMSKLSNFILKNYNNKDEKITFTDFLKNYLDFIKTIIRKNIPLDIQNDILNTIQNNFNKMRTLDYYNLFVSYALNIYDLVNTTQYVSDEDKSEITTAFMNYSEKLIPYDPKKPSGQHGKVVTLPKRIQPMDQDYADYIKKINELETETQQYEQQLKRGIAPEFTLLETKRRKEFNVIEEYGRDDYDQMMEEQKEEFENIPEHIRKKDCKSDLQCIYYKNGKKYSNMKCEDELCVPSKDLIGTLCQKDDDCMSGYCDNTHKSKLKFCRKK